MSNKTALQELIEKANRFKEVSFTGKLDIDEVIKELNNSLDKEKQQIMEAYNEGYSESTEEVPMTHYEYYDYKSGNPQGDQETTK